MDGLWSVMRKVELFVVGEEVGVVYIELIESNKWSVRKLELLMVSLFIRSMVGEEVGVNNG
jgi:predicted nuclease of restriction endonuclease-like (RecB) superfamily